MSGLIFLMNTSFTEKIDMKTLFCATIIKAWWTGYRTFVLNFLLVTLARLRAERLIFSLFASIHVSV